MLRHRLGRELGIKAALDHAALVSRALFERCLVDFRLPGLGCHLQEGGTERCCEREDDARVVHIFVDQLVVHSHPVALARIVRRQRRLGEDLIEVIEDQRGFPDRHAVVDQRRHNAVRVEPQVRRIVLVSAQRHDVVVGLQALFHERNAHLLGADRIDAVVELEHFILTDHRHGRPLGPRSMRARSNAGRGDGEGSSVRNQALPAGERDLRLGRGL